MPLRTDPWTEGFDRTVAGTDIYVYSKNALEIMRRSNLHRSIFQNCNMLYALYLSSVSLRMPYKELYIMKECFLPLNVGLGLKKRSPFKYSINLKLKQLQEGGIVRGCSFLFCFSHTDQ